MNVTCSGSGCISAKESLPASEADGRALEEITAGVCDHGATVTGVGNVVESERFEVDGTAHITDMGTNGTWAEHRVSWL